MFKNLFKYSLNIMTVLTGLAVIVFFALQKADSIIALVTKYPLTALSAVVVLCLWITLLFVISMLMLFSGKHRDQAFLMTSHTEIRDELEDKAVSEAIKKTFTFNLAFLTFIFVLSGLQYSTYKDGLGKQHTSYGYTIFSQNFETNHEDYKSFIATLPLEKQTKLKDIGFSADTFKDLEANTKFLIPRSYFSAVGVLFLIFLQFAVFKLFFFLNLKALNSDDEEE